jgi:glc operon protein GlcG
MKRLKAYYFFTVVFGILSLLGATSASGQIVFNKKTISTEAAEQMTNACLDWYKSHSVRGKPTVWVLDANGDTIYVKRIDGANRVGIETARMKAQSALYLFRPTKAIGNFAQTPSGAPSPVGEAMLILLNGYPSAGGLPIVMDGEVIGAIGVGGMAPDQAQGIFPDEQCAQAGIEAVFKK